MKYGASLRPLCRPRRCVLGLETLEPRAMLWATPQMLDIQPSLLVEFNDQLLVGGADASSQRGLWISDGTASGTKLLATDNSGFWQAAEVNGVLFLANAEQIWKTDGTPAGTTLVKQLTGYPDSPNAADLTAAGGYLFFTAGSYFNHSRGLWRTDGTEAGTILLKTFNYQSDWPAQLTGMGDSLYFTAEDSAHTAQLWKSDGTIVGTKPVTGSTSNSGLSLGSGYSDLTAVGNDLFFRASTEEFGVELWISDGTAAGTHMVKDVYPGASGSTSIPVGVVDDTLYFMADDGMSGLELWKTDGTEAETRLVKDIFPPANQYWLGPVFDLDGVFFFSADDGAHGMELWRTDGSESGTWMVQDSIPGEQGTWPSSWGAAVLNEKLFYQANDNVHGNELWMTDGTSAGTRRVADIWPGQQGSNTWHPTVAGNKLFWAADDGRHGGVARLWVLGAFEADVNGDHRVNLSDFGLLKSAFGEAGPNLPTDLDKNGVVDLNDFAILKAHFGQQELILEAPPVERGMVAQSRRLATAAAFATEYDFAATPTVDEEQGLLAPLRISKCSK